MNQAERKHMPEHKTYGNLPNYLCRCRSVYGKIYTYSIPQKAPYINPLGPKSETPKPTVSKPVWSLVHHVQVAGLYNIKHAMADKQSMR